VATVKFLYFVLGLRKGLHARWNDCRLSYVLSAISVLFAGFFGCVNHPKVVDTADVYDNVFTNNIRMNIMARRLEGNIMLYAGGEA
jgi:hypothetical protein